MKAIEKVARSLTAACWLLTAGVQADLCNSADISLTTQGQVDAFQDVYGPCDGVAAELIIGGVGAEANDIASLEPLAGLDAIGGTLRIGYVSLGDLTGLHGLQSVGGIYLFDNPNLQSLDVFANIETVAGVVEISGSPELADLGGLSGIAFIGDSLQLSDLPSVTTLQTLQSLSSVGSLYEFGGIFLRNLGIANLAGLENVTVLDGQLKLEYNENLVSLDGFPSAVTTLQALTLNRNYELRDIGALAGVTEINGNYPEGGFLLTYSSVRRLDGLEGLERVDQGFSLIYNSRLRDCSALRKLFDEVDDGQPGPGIGPIPDVTGTVHFVNNAGTCNSSLGMFDYIFWHDFE